jgi:hypothetical protein
MEKKYARVDLEFPVGYCFSGSVTLATYGVSYALDGKDGRTQIRKGYESDVNLELSTDNGLLSLSNGAISFVTLPVGSATIASLLPPGKYRYDHAISDDASDDGWLPIVGGDIVITPKVTKDPSFNNNPTVPAYTVNIDSDTITPLTGLLKGLDGALTTAVPGVDYALPGSGGGGTGGDGVAWLGAWSSSTTYAALDAVSLNGSSYVCVLGHTNHTPPNLTYWNVLAAKGDTGSTGSTGATGAAGAAGAAGPNTVSTSTSTNITGLLKGTGTLVAQASAGTDYVATDDSRLTNARTPSAHASTHGSGQADAISIASSQVSGLGGAALLAVGTTAGTVCAGNDVRLQAQIYSGAWDDPTGNVTPTDQSISSVYYKLQASPVVIWLWNTTSQTWFNALS